MTAATPTTRPQYTLAELLAEMPEGLPRVDGWAELPDVGLEVWPPVSLPGADEEVDD